MCRLCNPKTPQLPCPTRRDFLTSAAVGGATVAAGMTLPTGVSAQQAIAEAALPAGIGEPCRRILIKGGAEPSMDDAVGNFPVGDVLI